MSTSLLSLGCAPTRALSGRRPHACVTIRGSRRGAVQVRAFTEVEGPTGLNIQGSRVTSPRAFEIIKETLRGAGVKLVGPQEAEAAAKRGSPVLIDIRPAGDYSKGRVPGSVGVEFYRFITGWGAWQTVRRFGYAFFGIKGTEPNPDFLEQVSAAVKGKKNAGVILICSLGGDLDKDSSNTKHGKQTRSLVAAFALVQAGYSSVKVLSGGYSGWAKAGRLVEEEE